MLIVLTVCGRSADAQGRARSRTRIDSIGKSRETEELDGDRHAGCVGAQLGGR